MTDGAHSGPAAELDFATRLEAEPAPLSAPSARARPSLALRPGPAVERFGRISPRDLRRLLAALALLTGVWLLAIGAMTHHRRIGAFLRGECDLLGRWRYEPRHPVDPAAFSAMDIDGVHWSLLPRWVAATGRSLDDPEAEARTFEQVRRAVEADPGLVELLDEQRRILSEGTILGEAERLAYLVWAWNRRLDRAGLPYVVDGRVGVARSRRPFFYVTVYGALADVELSVGGRPSRVRIARRVDPVDVRELHVGGAFGPEEGALVVADRLQEFAVDSVWPLLGGELDLPGDPIGRAHAVAVRREVEEALGPDRFALLARTAPARAALLEAASSVAERAVCSGLAVTFIPFDGHGPRALELLDAVATLSLGSECPVVKVEEMIVFYKASAELRAEEELRRALEDLLGWIARSVAVHEARHLADLDRRGRPAVRCPTCGPESVAAEVSAYLASFAWGDGPHSAYYQACRAVQSGRNPHAAALEAIDGWLDHECERGPPADLVARSRAMEEERLGRSEPIVLPEGFPRRIGLARSAGSRRTVVEAEPAEG